MSSSSFNFSAASVAELARADARRALQEDVGDGDLTAALVPAGKRAVARVITRENAVLCGAPWVEAVLSQLAPQARLSWHRAEGQHCEPNQTVLTIEGDARSLLTAERTSLNFLQMLSAVATRTAQYVKAIEGTRARIVDTRKTLPGLRLAQKYAVGVGGGTNHRIGLFDAMMLKENHIIAAGGISAAVRAARRIHPNLPLIVEVETLDELAEAIAAGADRALLDNFTPAMLTEAVKRTAGRIPLEVSGNVEIDTIRAIAETGVDFISSGALTKNVRAIDLSLRLDL